MAKLSRCNHIHPVFQQNIKSCKNFSHHNCQRMPPPIHYRRMPPPIHWHRKQSHSRLRHPHSHSHQIRSQHTPLRYCCPPCNFYAFYFASLLTGLSSTWCLTWCSTGEWLTYSSRKSASTSSSFL